MDASPATVTGVVRAVPARGSEVVDGASRAGRKPSIAPQKVSEIVRATWHEKPPG